MDLKRGPEKGVAVAGFAPHVQLRLAQRGRRGAFVLEQGAVEAGHQPRRGLVADAPQADDNLGRPGVHEATGQSDQPFATDKRAQPGFAGAEDDEFGGQLQVEDVRQPDDAFAWLPSGIKP